MRSDTIKKGSERAPHRELLRATGQIQNESDFQKRFIGIANSYIDLAPGWNWRPRQSWPTRGSSYSTKSSQAISTAGSANFVITSRSEIWVSPSSSSFSCAPQRWPAPPTAVCGQVGE